MDFLENIDNDIINETYVDETVVEKNETKPTKKKSVVRKKPITVKKDSSVKLIESRIRTKLDNIGLNESAISEVVSFVLGDVQRVKNITSTTTKPNTPQQSKTPNQVKEQRVPITIMSRAESLLEGLPEAPGMGPRSKNIDSESMTEENLSDVASRASSLL